MRLVAVLVAIASLLGANRAHATPTVTPIWSRIDLGLPSTRFNQTMAYDSALGRTMMYGGYANLSDLWSWDGLRWTRQVSAHEPPGGGYPRMTFDKARSKVVLLANDYTGTWEWDGTDWTKITSVHMPTVDNVMDEQLFFDEKLGQTILLCSYNNAFGTWTWDGNDWHALSPAHEPDAASCVAYDTLRQRGVLVSMTNASVGETWEWDSTDWTLLSPSAAITPRTICRATFDVSRKTSIVIGGEDASHTELADAWSWDGTGWTELSSSTPPTFEAAIAYDPGCSCDVVFSYASTWEFDASGWSDHTVVDRPTSSPSTFAYDDIHKRSILVNQSDWKAQAASSTWTWDGISWAQQVTAHHPNFSLAFAFHTASARAVMFGGDSLPSNETWLWDGNDWTLAAPTTLPDASVGSGLVYDSARARLVLFGGRLTSGWSAETWEWDGNDWTHVQPATKPPPRTSPGLAYDAANKLTVLFGSAFINQYLDTWTYDGKTWTQQFPTTSPDRPAVLVYDSARQRVLAFTSDPSTAGKLWEWDGTNWTLDNTPAAPSDIGAMTYDRDRRRVVLFQPGMSSALGLEPVPDETWELHFRGGTCTSGGDCDTAICEDGTCCETTCGGPGDCLVCAVAAGAKADGLCDTAAVGAVCRPVAGGCDLAETCDGVSTSCPADMFVAAGTHCGEAACVDGTVSSIATCTGTSAACPSAVQNKCAPYVCSADGFCLTACSSDTQCVAGKRCANGACVDSTQDAGADSGSGGVDVIGGGCSCQTAPLQSRADLGMLLAAALASAARRRKRTD